MSQEPGYENYSEVNLNAIKNTKLFQKFMQNKSGLVSSNSSNNIANARTSETENQQEVSEIREKKWVKTQNRNKLISIAENVENSNEKEKKYEKESNNSVKNPFEQQIISIERMAEYETVPNKYFEEEIKVNFSGKLETFLQNNKNQSQQEVMSYESQNNSNPPVVPNRRKRNFNPNGESFRNSQQEEQRNMKIETIEPEKKLDEERSYTYGSNFSHEKLTEIYPENNLNLYNTSAVQEPIYFQPEQKLIKTQFSPSRTQYPHSYQISDQKMNVQELNISSNIIPPVITEGEYKQKYEQLLKKYEDLKHEVKNENKNRKKEFTEWEHEIDLIKEKDSLLIENQRLKEKLESENLLKMKTQEENKELGYKIKELEDELIMKENHIKQRSEETNYWKTQSDIMKQDLHGLKLNFEKRNDEYNLLYGDYQIVKKERDNKDFFLEDLRRNIAFLVEENSAAKDEIFKLITKLYQLEQENQMLKNDVKRQSFDNSQLNNYMKDLHQQSRDRILSTQVERTHERSYERPHNEREYDSRNERPIHKNESFIVKEPTNIRSSLTEQERPIPEKQTRRRGEFARERGQLTRNEKIERDERPLPTTQNIHNVSIPEEHQKNQPKQHQFTNNKMGRINEILEELEKIKDMKAMNGAIRRRKIELERELQEIETQ